MATVDRARRPSRHRLAVVLAGIASLAMVLPAWTALADARPAPPACNSAPTYVRADIVDATGMSDGVFVDSRCTNRVITVSLTSRYHYIVQSGVGTPGATVTVGFRSSVGEVGHTVTATVEPSGRFHTEITDLALLAANGQKTARFSVKFYVEAVKITIIDSDQ
jgi:hypothetical protein